MTMKIIHDELGNTYYGKNFQMKIFIDGQKTIITENASTLCNLVFHFGFKGFKPVYIDKKCKILEMSDGITKIVFIFYEEV